MKSSKVIRSGILEINKELIKACKKGDLEMVKFLINNGSDIPYEKDVALLWACKKGHLDIVKYLIKKGANICIGSGKALELAISKKHFEIAKYLLNKDITYCARRLYKNLIFRIVHKYKQIDIIKLLIEKLDINDLYIIKTLIWACKNGYLEIVKKYKEKGGDIHYDKEFLLYIAMENKQFDIVKYIIKDGVDIKNISSKIFSLALKYKQYDIIKDVINKHGVNVLLRWGSKNGDLDLVKLAIENGANIHTHNDYALCWACENGYLNIVKYLIKKGANIHANDDYPIFIANMKGHTDIVKYLIEKGIDINEIE